jgi:hypothetical protein
LYSRLAAYEAVKLDEPHKRVKVLKIRMEQNVGGSPSSVMDKIQHWLKDVRGDLASSVKKMCYINENIKI